MPNVQKLEVDFIEAGAGPLVVLVHSSMSGARQWSRLMDGLCGRFRVRAINLFGYGGTPPWQGEGAPSLDDFAELVIAAIPPATRNVAIVGHSFGAAVAMRAAGRRPKSIEKLVLIEPSLFYLLNLAGRTEAFAEIAALSHAMKRDAAAGSPATAAEQFIAYWAGPEAWAANSPDRKATFTRSVKLVLNEWDAVLAGETTPEQWAATLPDDTMVVVSAEPTRPSQEVIDVLSETCTHWEFRRAHEGGHMAPLTHPELINAMVASFLGRDPAIAGR